MLYYWYVVFLEGTSSSFPESGVHSSLLWNTSCISISEGLAVGVGFGAIGKSVSATFENARLVTEILNGNEIFSNDAQVSEVLRTLPPTLKMELNRFLDRNVN